MVNFGNNLMTEKKIHYWILGVSIALCAFMLIETNWLPTKSHVEKIKNFKALKNGGTRYRERNNYYIETNRRKYDVTEGVYLAVSRGDSVAIIRSLISGAVQKIVVSVNGNIYVYQVGFIWLGGWLFPAIVIAAVIILMFYYPRIDYLQGRRNLTYCFFIVTLVMFFNYLSIFI